jgi:hypothetical protein
MEPHLRPARTAKRQSPQQSRNPRPMANPPDRGQCPSNLLCPLRKYLPSRQWISRWIYEDQSSAQGTMKKQFPLSFEFVYQIFSLILIIIVVHAVYVAVIRPRSDAILAEQAALLKEDKSRAIEPSVYVIIRDFEQETEIILMFWRWRSWPLKVS